MSNFVKKLLFGKIPRITEDSFHSILEAIPVSVVITDPNQDDNPIVFCNSAFEEVTGYKREEVLGKNCRFLQGEDTEKKTLLKIKKAIKDIKPVNVVITNYTKTGVEFINELIIVPVITDDKLEYFIAIQNDIARPTYISSQKEIEKTHGKG